MSRKIEKLSFSSDYLEGTHPKILQAIVDTNLLKTSGYGTDEFTAEAADRIRTACGAPNAEVRFLVGGTQTNAVVIDALLRSYQGVIAAESGHINGHEAGAIEFGGHKVLTIHQKNGKITAEQIHKTMEQYHNDGNREHVVMPGMVYITHPTEYGTLYSLKELTDISKVCRSYHLPLYLDGARLAYALASEQNDISLMDLARLCDAFYIGGTKCGTLFGEAVVVSDPSLIPHFFTIIKQHGAHLEKGRLLGVQFSVMFTDDLYLSIGKTAVEYAGRIKEAFRAKGYRIYLDTPTNQVFVVLGREEESKLFGQLEFGFWERLDNGDTVYRIATNWATREEDVNKLIKLL